MVTGDEGTSIGVVKNGHGDIDAIAKYLEESETPSIRGSHVWMSQVVAIQEYTNFIGGEAGLIITIIAGDAPAMIPNGAYFNLKNSWKPSAGDTITLTFIDDKWYEISRSNNGDMYHIHDDFENFTDATRWTSAQVGGGAVPSITANAIGGVLGMATHTDNTDAQRLAMTNAIQNWNTSGTTFKARVNTSRITQSELRVGVGDDTQLDGPAANAYYFEFDSADNANHIYACVNTAGTVVTGDTMIHLAADTYKTFEIRKVGEVIRYYIDNRLTALTGGGALTAIVGGFVGKPAVNVVNKTGAAVTASVDYVTISGPRV